MRRWLTAACVTILGIVPVACGREAAPVHPSPIATSVDAAPADGSTLKIKAPPLLEPGGGFQFPFHETQMLFSWTNVTGTYAVFPVSYDLQLKDASNNIVVFKKCPAAPGAITSCTVPVAALRSVSSDLTHIWGVRAVHAENGALVGPWAGRTLRAPRPILTLTAIPSVVVLPLRQSMQISAQVQLALGSSDFVPATEVVAWTSAQSDVATVAGGLVTAKRVGQTTVTATVLSTTVIVPVTVLDESSRVLFLRGRITVRCSGRSCLGSADVFLDGRSIGGISSSENGNSELTASIGITPSPRLLGSNVLRPHGQELTVVVRPRDFGFVSGTVYSVEFRPPFEVVDKATGEVVRVIGLPAQEAPAGTGDTPTFRWPISLPPSAFNPVAVDGRTHANVSSSRASPSSDEPTG